MLSRANAFFGKTATVLTSGAAQLQQTVWPIHRKELPRFLLLFIVNGLVVFNYTLLKITKDSLVITASTSGAEVIPFIKVWSILPMAILFTVLFNKLSHKFSQEKVFYIMMAIFLGFYLAFALAYPFHEQIHMHGFADALEGVLPSGFRGLLAVFRNWSFTLFYVMAELWSSMMMTVIFWGFVNEITSMDEAKRYYGILSAGANIATIFAGQIAIHLSSEWLNGIALFAGYDAWGKSLLQIIALTTTCGLTACFVFWFMHRKYKLSTSSLALAKVPKKAKKQKIKLGFAQSLAYLFKSRYLMAIAVIVVTYNIVINMIEVIWKDQVKLAYPNPNDFNVYMGQAMTWIGIISVFVSLLACTSIINRYGWRLAAMVTPLLVFSSGAFFFFFILFRDTELAHWSVYFGMTPLALGVFFGTAQNIICRVCKFTIFDATKEIAFIPLASEVKLQGKAAIDGIGSRLGKSGGSILHQSLLLCFGSLAASTPYVGMLLFVFAFMWIASINTLSKEMDKQAIDEAEAAPQPQTAQLAAAQPQ